METPTAASRGVVEAFSRFVGRQQEAEDGLWTDVAFRAGLAVLRQPDEHWRIQVSRNLPFCAGLAIGGQPDERWRIQVSRIFWYRFATAPQDAFRGKRGSSALRFELEPSSGEHCHPPGEVGRAPSIQDLQPVISGVGKISGRSASNILAGVSRWCSQTKA